MSERPIYLLYKDGRVAIQYKSLAKLIRKRKVERVKWVLIPIANTSATYVAVSGDVLSAKFDNFGSAIVRYHMQLCGSPSYTEVNEFNGEVEGPPGLLWDYETVGISCETLEEFYNALYQPYAYGYLRSLLAYSDRDEDYWFIHVADIEVTCYDRDGKEIEHLYVEGEFEISDVPFPYDGATAVMNKVATTFGFTDTDFLHYHKNIIIYWNKLHILHWEEIRGRFLLTSDVHTACVANTLFCSYMVLDADAYAAMLRMNTANIYLSPFAVEFPDKKAAETWLPIAAAYEVPKYQFAMDYSSQYEILVEPMFSHFYGELINNQALDLLDSEDIGIFIDHIYFLGKVLVEGAKVNIATAKTSYKPASLSELKYAGTAIIECHVDLDYQAEPALPKGFESFSIFTDPWESNPPNIREVCYLLQLAEKEK